MKEPILLNPLNLSSCEVAVTKFIPRLETSVIIPEQETPDDEWWYTEKERFSQPSPPRQRLKREDKLIIREESERDQRGAGRESCCQR